MIDSTYSCSIQYAVPPKRPSGTQLFKTCYLHMHQPVRVLCTPGSSTTYTTTHIVAVQPTHTDMPITTAWEQAYGTNCCCYKLVGRVPCCFAHAACVQKSGPRRHTTAVSAHSIQCANLLSTCRTTVHSGAAPPTHQPAATHQHRQNTRKQQGELPAVTFQRHCVTL